MSYFCVSNRRTGLLLWAGFLLAATAGASTIQFQVAEIGTNASGQAIDRFTYSTNGITLDQNEAVDLSFDRSRFSDLTNPVVPAGFVSNLAQPDNPLGLDGDFIISPQSGAATLSGPFSVDFTFIGSGVPDVQAFTIYEFDPQTGFIVSVLETGTTTPGGVAGTPEPASFATCGVLLAVGGMMWAVRRRCGMSGLV
ncbi:MAG: hypothetical protein JO022_17480 [Acidobacteriaceae bacterium]|nr:hypothetical protein [Acidobacteriaceae bacterium]